MLPLPVIASLICKVAPKVDCVVNAPVRAPPKVSTVRLLVPSASTFAVPLAPRESTMLSGTTSIVAFCCSVTALS